MKKNDHKEASVLEKEFLKKAPKNCYAEVVPLKKCKEVPNKHTTCVSRWNGKETVASTSFQRRIHLVCLWGSFSKNKTVLNKLLHMGEGKLLFENKIIKLS